MLKMYALALLLVAVSYFVVDRLISLYYKMKREEDEDLQIRIEVNNEMEDLLNKIRRENDHLNAAKNTTTNNQSE